MGKRVLIAEDEPNIATSLAFLLERAGYQVSIASNGAEALDAIDANTPDALLLDLMLPAVDGYEVLRRVRGNPKSADLPVLVLTAKGQKEDRETAEQSGANAFVTKPFANAELLDAVDRLFGSNR
ncbi:MAG: response regulator [Pseudomonadota bacterium]